MSLRSQRLEKQIMQELTVILRAVKDPELSGFLTITEVRMSKNLKIAQVYYSILGTDEDRKSTARALERATGFLRHALADKIFIKRMPGLAFSYDPTPEHADRIERIIDKLEQERETFSHEQPPQDAETPGGPGDPQS